MDTRSRKWTNKVLITLVMIAMTLSGIYGLNTIHNMALTGDNSFSLDEQDQSDYIKHTQMSLFDKWADQESNKVYYTQANHVSESLLNKIKKESFVKVTMKVKPYDKKMVTTTSTYGTENANYTGGRIEHFHIERDKTEKLNKDGSFKGWDPYDDYDEYSEYIVPQTEYYEFSGDNYTLRDIFPEQLLINDEKNQRLENADIEISLTKKALTEIENFRKGSTKQITTGIKTIIVVSIIEVIGTILLCILFALQEKRTRFFRGLDRLWWEIILVTAITLLGLAIALCFAIWEYTIEYTQGVITGSTIEMIMTLSYISVPFFIMAFAVCIQTTVWRIRQKNLLDSTFCLGYFRKWSRYAKTRRKLEDEAMSFAEKHARDRIRQYRVLRYIMIGGVAVCVIILFTGAQLSDFLVTLIAITCISLFKFFKKYSNKYAEEQRDLGKLVDQIERISNGELTAITDISEDSDYYEYSQKLTHIGQGMEKALETQMKGERMKIDLITNVSHDIKTPLTSIINYVDLLKRENPEDPKIRGYLEVLENKAQRLKVLTEDVVEASKASTGNIALEMTDLNFIELVHQVIGEFEEKFEERNLKMVVHFDEEEAIICADGRRLWRVLENVFGNVSKYAMENTRVYVDVKVDRPNVQLSLKNISAQPLNISAEELTERFIRGDVSRNTEGSGLGLSIAKDLVQLQGGEFKLYLDGDLFKVTIEFKMK